MAALAAAGVAAVAVAATAGAVERAERPVVLAAASLAETLPRIEPSGRYSFGGSNQLAQQIRQGAPFDVFLSASPVYTRALHREGLVRRPVSFATNELVLVVPRSNPRRIRTVGDLARRPSLRLVVAGPEVPAGAYTRQALGRLGLLAVLRRALSLEPDVKGVVGKVVLGEADAGFVYASDARAAGSKVRVVRLPERARPDIRYEAAVSARPRSEEAARAFVARLRGSAGVRALRAAGLGAP